MKAGLLLGLFLTLSTFACASTPSSEPIDPSKDPSWIPPGQGDLAVGDDPEPKAAKPKKARHLQQPNKSDVANGHVQAMK
jgi:hypothetical protein